MGLKRTTRQAGSGGHRAYGKDCGTRGRRERIKRQAVEEKLAKANKKLTEEVVFSPSGITANDTVEERDGAGRTKSTEAGGEEMG